MTSPIIFVHVEGNFDKYVVLALLNRLFDPEIVNHINILTHNGKKEITQSANSPKHKDNKNNIYLIDSDINSIADSKLEAQKQLGISHGRAFCAIPTIEAWLFADPNAAKRLAKNDNMRSICENLPLPEMIPYPKQLAHYIFGDIKNSERFLTTIFSDFDIELAIARSSSLRDFVNGIQSALNIHRVVTDNYLHTSVTRDLFTSLLQELPNEKIIWKTLDGATMNTREMKHAVYEGTDIGTQYISEVLRIARDMIARKAQK